MTVSRPAERADIIPVYKGLWAAEYPKDLRTEAEVALVYMGLPDGAFEQNWVIEDEGDPAGVVIIVDPAGDLSPKRLTGDVSLHLDHEEQAVPVALDLFERACHSCGAASFSVWTSDLLPRRVQLYESAGLSCIQKAPVSRLDLSDFDFRRWDSAVERVLDTGLQFVSVEELDRRGVDWKHRLYLAVEDMARDIPSPHGPHPSVPFDRWLEWLEDHERFPRNLMFAAMDGEEFVGYSRLMPSLANPGLAYTAMSGVARPYRRRGIVTALKVLGLRALRDLGYRVVQTDNNEINPMFDLNVALGFQTVWTWLEFEKVLVPAAPHV
ncbi:MAG TPA: GNAT family N-acetyltransferase [Fimbriimonadaceae bacterium]|nr:GNAT family N-acetyltransferase [Fimbriimonadaceae bacterium]